MVFLPFALIAWTQHLIARSYGDRLSDLVASVVVPFTFGSSDRANTEETDEVPVAAILVPEDVEFDVSDLVAKTARLTPAAIARGKAPSKPSTKPVPSSVEKTLPAIFVAAQTVLRIANSGQRPSGRSVTAQGRRPAGVQVFGASALGIGVRDGDIITKVNGVPVTSANQVIALVIAARGARQPAISAQMYRGQRSYVLTVEQPYIPAEVQTPHAASQPSASLHDSEPSPGG